MPSCWVIRRPDPLPCGCPRRSTAHQTRAHRTITVDVQHAATDFQRLGDGKACVAVVLACILARGVPLNHTAPWRSGGCVTRPAHSIRVRRGRRTLWRRPCTTCQAVVTVLPQFVLRYRQTRPELVRKALVAPPTAAAVEHGARRLVPSRLWRSRAWAVPLAPRGS